MGNDTYQMYRLKTNVDGSIDGVTETNDNEDRGLPGKVESWPVRFASRQAMDRRGLKSGVGIGGCRVTVVLDGQPI